MLNVIEFSANGSGQNNVVICM